MFSEGSMVDFTKYDNVKLEVPAASIDGRTMVPLRFAGEAFGKKVGWYPNGDVKIISITE